MLVLVGCAGGRSSQVGARMIVPPMASTMKMQEQQVFLMAEHLNPERLPAYPPALMDAGPEAKSNERGRRLCQNCAGTIGHQRLPLVMTRRVRAPRGLRLLPIETDSDQ